MNRCDNCNELIPEDEGFVENSGEVLICLSCAGVSFFLDYNSDLNFEEENELWECTLMDGLEDEEEWDDD